MPGKNFRKLNGRSPLLRAFNCACEAAKLVDGPVNRWQIIVSSDRVVEYSMNITGMSDEEIARFNLQPFIRPPHLATDTARMADVVEHALREVPGPFGQIVLLTQPTQPLRRPEHLQAAVNLLRQRDTEGCVVSVVPTESLDKSYTKAGWELLPCGAHVERRQDATQTFKRDGTVYAWRRGYGSLYSKPLIALEIDPAESCALDTPCDWEMAELRLKAKEAACSSV